MADSNQQIVYTAEDIQRYLEGKMSNGEMHAIEKAALDDPLLAEAIEGYAGMEEKDWTGTLGDLRSKFTLTQDIPVISLKNRQFRNSWKVAAAVIVLIAGAGLTYLFTTNKQDVTLAEQHVKPISSDSVSTFLSADTFRQQSENDETKNTSSAIAPPAQDLASTEAETLSVSPLVKESEAKSDFVYTPKSKPEAKPVTGGGDYNNSSDDNAVSAAPGNNSNAGRLSNESNVSNMILDENFKKVAENINDKELQKSVKAPAGNNLNINSFKGLVVAKDNTPLAFAQVYTNATKQPVYTDKEGFFKITSPDTAVRIEVSSAGYESKTIVLKQADAGKKVVLEPVPVAEKKLSSGKQNTDVATAKRRAEQQKEIEDQEEDEATPVNGWEEYNSYLSNHGNISDKNIHGVVEVFVNLDKNGAISKIKVDKSLCAECDAEAVRLVKEGPKWDVKSNKARKVKVKVKF